MLRRFSFLILLAGCATSAPPQKSAAPPSTTTASAPLPSIDLTTLDGQPTKMERALGGRPALVSLWATWCEACAGEFEPLERLAARAQSVGAVVIAVAVGEPRQKVEAFVKAHQLGYTQLVDEEFHFADGLGQKRVPATLVIDRGGRVVYVGGVLDESALAALEKAVNAHVTGGAGQP
jgi:peroxiredoxin